MSQRPRLTLVSNHSSSGWKGTLLGIAMATVTTMVTEFGCHVSNISVVVGPSVGVCCFQLDQDQALAFSRLHPDCVPDPESATPHVNIRLANRCVHGGKGRTPTEVVMAPVLRQGPAGAGRRPAPAHPR